jgi:hypothetical protein
MSITGLYVVRKSANTFEVRELTGGKLVGRYNDIKQDRCSKSTFLPTLPTSARRPVLIAAGGRGFIAVEKEARERVPKDVEKVKARMRACLRRAGNGSASHSETAKRSLF